MTQFWKSFFFSKDQENILHCLASVLHICDVSFSAADEGSSVSNPSHVELVAELLQVDSKELAACFIQEATVTRGILYECTLYKDFRRLVYGQYL